jgi:hypothetical protein
MKKAACAAGVVVVLVLATAPPALAAKPDNFNDSTGAVSHTVADTGFDVFGYNYTARIFSGVADGVDRVLDGTVWGDATYANDYLVMKWSQAWDDARFHNEPWTTDAWVMNEWVGMRPDGSREVWHYKIQWIGNCGSNGTLLPDGGYCIWRQFEVLMDQGTSPDGHVWYAHAVPNGYGA